MYRVLFGVLGSDRLGADLHLFGFLATSSLPQQGGVVLKARGHTWVLRPQGLFPDRQRALVERLGGRCRGELSATALESHHSGRN